MSRYYSPVSKENLIDKRLFFGPQSQSRLLIKEEQKAKQQLKDDIQSALNRKNLLERKFNYTCRHNNSLFQQNKLIQQSQEVRKQRIIDEVNLKMKLEHEKLQRTQSAKLIKNELQNNLQRSKYVCYLQKQEEGHQEKQIRQHLLQQIEQNNQNDFVNRKMMAIKAKQQKAAFIQRQRVEQERKKFQLEQSYIEQLNKEISEKNAKLEIAKELQQYERSWIQRLGNTQQENANLVLQSSYLKQGCTKRQEIQQNYLQNGFPSNIKNLKNQTD